MQRKNMFGGAPSASAAAKAVPAKTKFVPNKTTGSMHERTPEQKVICALQKILVDMSDKMESGDRLHIQGGVHFINEPSSSANSTGPRTYKSTGRCQIGVAHRNGTKGTKIIEFAVTCRDSEDDRGVPDIIYLPESVIDELPRNTKL